MPDNSFDITSSPEYASLYYDEIPEQTGATNASLPHSDITSSPEYASLYYGKEYDDAVREKERQRQEDYGKHARKATQKIVQMLTTNPAAAGAYAAKEGMLDNPDIRALIDTGHESMINSGIADPKKSRDVSMSRSAYSDPLTTSIAMVSGASMSIIEGLFKAATLPIQYLSGGGEPGEDDYENAEKTYIDEVNEAFDWAREAQDGGIDVAYGDDSWTGYGVKQGTKLLATLGEAALVGGAAPAKAGLWARGAILGAHHGMQTASRSITQEKQGGATDAEAKFRGSLDGLITGTLTFGFSGHGISRLATGVGGKTIAQSAKDASATVGKKLLSFAKEFVVEGSFESTEEVLDSLGGRLRRYVTNDDLNAFNLDDIERDFKDILVLSFLGSGVTNMRGSFKAYSQDSAMKDFIDNPSRKNADELIPFFRNEIENSGLNLKTKTGRDAAKTALQLHDNIKPMVRPGQEGKFAEEMNSDEVESNIQKDSMKDVLSERKFYDDESILPGRQAISVRGLPLANDSHGHDAGNQYLQDFADKVKKAGGKLYRVGGPKFAVRAKTDAEAAAIAKEVSRTVEGTHQADVDSTVELRDPFHKRLSDMTPEEKRTALTIDDGTQLKNERKFREDIRTKKPKSIVMIDMDSVGAMKEDQGNDFVDEAMRKVGIALKENKVDVYRLHGDEFAAIGISKKDLQKQIDKAMEGVSITTKGGTHAWTPKFSLGEGKTEKAADSNLLTTKSDRERNKLRSPKGNMPVSLRPVEQVGLGVQDAEASVQGMDDVRQRAEPSLAREAEAEQVREPDVRGEVLPEDPAAIQPEVRQQVQDAELSQVLDPKAEVGGVINTPEMMAAKRQSVADQAIDAIRNGFDSFVLRKLAGYDFNTVAAVADELGVKRGGLGPKDIDRLVSKTRKTLETRLKGRKVKTAIREATGQKVTQERVTKTKKALNNLIYRAKQSASALGWKAGRKVGVTETKENQARIEAMRDDLVAFAKQELPVEMHDSITNKLNTIKTKKGFDKAINDIKRMAGKSTFAELTARQVKQEVRKATGQTDVSQGVVKTERAMLKMVQKAKEKASNMAWRERGKEISTLQSQLIKAAVRGQVISAIKGATTAKGFEKAVARIDEVAAKTEHDDAVKKVKTRIAKAKKKFKKGGEDFKKMAPEFRDAMQEIVGGIDQKKRSTGVKKAIEYLRGQSEDIDSDSFLKHHEAGLKLMGKENLYDYTAEDLEQIDDTLRYIMESQSDQAKAKAEAEKTEQDAKTKEITDNLPDVQKGERGQDITKEKSLVERALGDYSKYAWMDETIRSLAIKFDGNKENGPFSRLVDNVLTDMRDNTGINKENLTESLKESLGGPVDRKMSHEFSGRKADTKPIDLGDGRSMVATAGQKVYLYLATTTGRNREALLSTRSVGNDRFKTGSKKSKVERNDGGMTEDAMQKLQESMTEEELRVAESMRELFNGAAKDMVNEATMERWNYEIATEDNYLPIYRDSADIKKTASEEVGAQQNTGDLVENLGFLKELTKSQAGLIIPDIFAVASNHIHNVSLLNATVMDARSINGIMNNNEIRRKVEAEYGEDAYKVFTEMVNRSMGKAKKSQDNKATRKLTGNIAGAVLMASPRVWMMQPMSLLNASNVLSKPSLAKAALAAKTAEGQKIIAEMLSRSIRLRSRKKNSGFDRDYASGSFGNDLKSELTEDTWQDSEWLDLISKSDNLAMEVIMLASYYDSNNDFDSGAKLADKAVRDTQPTWAPETRNYIEGSDNELIRAVTMFRSYRSKQLEHLKVQARVHGVKSKQFMHSVTMSLAIGAMMNTLTKAIWRKITSDEEEEVTWAEFFGGWIADAATVFPIAGDILGGFAKTAITGELPHFDTFDSPLLSATSVGAKGMYQMALSAHQAINKEKYKTTSKYHNKGDSKAWASAKRAAKEALGAANVTGKPIEGGFNLIEDVYNILRNTKDLVDGDEKKKKK